MKIYLKSFGCKVNTAEEQVVLSKLAKYGYEYCSDIGHSDIVLVNSCAVTDTATEKVLSYIRNIDTDNGRRKIVVTGCVASDKNVNLKEFGVDTVIHNSAKSDIVELILAGKDSLEGFKSSGQSMLSGVADGGIYRTRTFFKIQDGCDAGCSYCIIPRVRGRSRSVEKRQLVDDFKKLVDNGSKEIVVVGIHIGLYGKEFGYDLYELLKEFNKVNGDFRIRLSSLEVNELDKRLIELISASDKITPHLHIPLQSGSDKILKLMNRHYGREYYIDKLNECRESINGVVIGADVMVGFPTETDDDFKLTVDTVNKAGIDLLHIFSYSDREGSVASTISGKVDNVVKKERVSILKSIADMRKREYEKQFVGKELRILAESGNKGHSGNYLLINCNQKVVRNNFYNVLIKEIINDKIYADVIL